MKLSQRLNRRSANKWLFQRRKERFDAAIVTNLAQGAGRVLCVAPNGLAVFEQLDQPRNRLARPAVPKLGSRFNPFPTDWRLELCDQLFVSTHRCKATTGLRPGSRAFARS